MADRALLSVVCVNRPGLLRALAACLAEAGCNLADTTFAALAGTAEMTAICDLPDGLARADVAAVLSRLPALAGAKVTLSAVERDDDAGVGAAHRISHRFEITGVDAPGAMARVVAAVEDAGAEIVRVNAHAFPSGGARLHVMRFAVAAGDRAEAVLAAATEAARALGHEIRVETA